jgi:starch-binding outer membrane protein SusE/F
MKKLNKTLLVSFFIILAGLGACEKDKNVSTYTEIAPPILTPTATNLVLSIDKEADDALSLSWTKAEGATNYTLEIDKKGNRFQNAQEYRISSGITTKKFTVKEVNDLAVTFGLTPERASDIEARVKGFSGITTAIYSKPVTISVTPYVPLEIDYPALLVKGGNAWQTPAIRTKGFLLSSPKSDSKYEGYLNLPNADGYGGDAFKLISTTTQAQYGWGGTNKTISIGGGNLWLTPAPAYMKVNVDINALTIDFTPCQFFISGDDNGWSTSATPMTYDAATKTLVANNVTLTAGKTFVFTCNGNYNISYKVDNTGKLIFAGPPTWSGVNIPITKTGVYTVTLDLSGGDGNYNYSLK